LVERKHRLKVLFPRQWCTPVYVVEEWRLSLSLARGASATEDAVWRLRVWSERQEASMGGQHSPTVKLPTDDDIQRSAHGAAKIGRLTIKRQGTRRRSSPRLSG